ncbi:MAG: methyltransferase domain-containing protein [Vicinamibacterales bacterium]|nr:methyltransferase domain-containing protein [Vicinamibacterales bacterium]
MRCLYLTAGGDVGIVDEPRLATTTERHKIELPAPASLMPGPPLRLLDQDPSLAGVIVEMTLGFAPRATLRLAREVLRRGRRVWLHWPTETAVECVDDERLASHWRHWVFIVAGFARQRLAGAVAVTLGRIAARLPGRLKRLIPARFHFVDTWASDCRVAELTALLDTMAPVPLTRVEPGASVAVPGTGAYLRTDFWARIDSGGSYGHTCYVAKELAATSDGFVCFMAHRYSLLDEYGLTQVALPPPPGDATEDVIVNATAHYMVALRPAFEILRPAYIYERLCLGNYAGALLSRQLGIPYIAEYNGSEISMRRSFDGVGYQYEREYLLAEAVAFRQATMISVVSEEVGASLIARGVDPRKILVNPNGADLTAYAPASPALKAEVRAEAGLDADAPVVGFTGTFGGWHGIDVLAAALPRLCARVPRAQFLLIGDGNYKHVIDKAIAEHQLQTRVRCTGRVPQAEGARLLKACDLYVSPHSSHMVDSKFFGSPTKIFEYMAMGGGIVASDLEQIGQVLSPALRAGDLADQATTAGEARAVLCEPGNVDEFVEAVAGLLARPDLWPGLGQNARRAVEQHYSWARHVARLWPFLAGATAEAAPVDPPRERAAAAPAADEAPAGIETGDRYKDEVQRQWDNDPAGSHYVKEARPHTLDWFREVEAYRYDEYAPWMAETMEFARHAGERVLEIGAGIGTDHVQFAINGAITTDIDLSSGHLELAKENFRLRGLQGTFVHHDAERLPFDDDTFDVVYSNGVIHHTPNTYDVVREIRRVLRPGGKAIVMVYAENSLHYWRNLVWAIGIREHALQQQSMGDIMSRSVERSDNAAARPLVKVYTPARLRQLFGGFDGIEIVQRQMVAAEKPRLLRWVPLPALGQWMGWNLVIKARKPGGAR